LLRKENVASNPRKGRVKCEGNWGENTGKGKTGFSFRLKAMTGIIQKVARGGKTYSPAGRKNNFAIRNGHKTPDGGREKEGGMAGRRRGRGGGGGGGGGGGVGRAATKNNCAQSS